MKKIFVYNSSTNIVKIEEENLEGISLRFTPAKNGGELAPLQDLSRAKIKITVERSQKTFQLFNGNLQDYNSGLNSLTPSYSDNLQAVNGVYEMLFKFQPLNLWNGDRMTIEFSVENTAFTALDSAKSSIEFETIPTDSVESFVQFVDTFPVGNSQDEFNQVIGSNVSGIVVATDYAATVNDTVKPLVSDMVLTAVGVKKEISGKLARRLNRQKCFPFEIDQINMNAYEGTPINNVRLRLDFTDAVDKDAKVIVNRTMYIGR